MAVRANWLAGALGVLWTFGVAHAAAPETMAPGDFPLASDVRLGGDDNQTRMVIDLSRKVDLRTFMLANPFRLVIDLPQVTFQFPPKTGEKGRGLIKAFRYGLVMQGGSRMVIDLARPARLMLCLAAVDRGPFLRTVALDNRTSDAPRPRRNEPDHKASNDPRPL